MPAAIITDGALWGRAFVPWQKRHFRPRDPFKREWVALPGAETQIAAEFGTVAMTVADADMPDLPPLNVIVTSVAAARRRDGDLPDDAAGAVRRDRRARHRGLSRRWSQPENAPSWPTGFSTTRTTRIRSSSTA